MPRKSAKHCYEQAAIAEREASAATLANVRDRQINARNTWLELAHRAERYEASAATRNASKPN